MRNFRVRTWLVAVLTLVVAWAAAVGGYVWAAQSKMTAEKVRRYMTSVQFDTLRGKQRAAAIAELEAKINALPPEERSKMRWDGIGQNWFRQMTEEERAAFVEAILPSGVEQMLTAFSKLPEARRKEVVDAAIQRLREGHQSPLDDGAPRAGRTQTDPLPVLSPELENKMRMIGLNTFYADSSAETKAELAPLLEEVQRTMQGPAGRP